MAWDEVVSPFGDQLAYQGSKIARWMAALCGLFLERGTAGAPSSDTKLGLDAAADLADLMTPINSGRVYVDIETGNRLLAGIRDAMSRVG